MAYPLSQVNQAVADLTVRLHGVRCDICGEVGAWRFAGVYQAAVLMDAAHLPPWDGGGHPTGHAAFFCPCGRVLLFDPRVTIAESATDSPS